MTTQIQPKTISNNIVSELSIMLATVGAFDVLER